MVTRIPVNGEVLQWARQTAGLDQETASERLRVKVDQLKQWEDGLLNPTMNQLRQLAKVYSRPLGALLMPEPPRDEVTPALPDFRRPSEQDHVQPAALQKAIIRARQQREDLLEISELLGEEIESRSPKFSFSKTDGPEKIGSLLRSLLKIDSLSTGKLQRPDETLRLLVDRVERLGVLVIQVQNVSADAMRGFSLAEDQFPVIALNGADWPRGKIFTLLHELVHVGLRASGLCDLQQESDKAVERLCDAAAGAALMPWGEMNALLVHLTRPLTVQQMSALGKEFGASGEAATLRFVSMGKVTWDEYFELRPAFRQAYKSYKADEKASRDGEAPIYYQLKVRDLGRPFIRKVLQAYGEDAVSSRDLAVMLDVKFDKVPKLATMVGAF
ncbi:ImmA/IrrE family metallo-endopeptidase [Luteococcus sp. Sow4_B9]|uniref:ImmA/IrrE family metallo-endopeptidase n=1 Tax=Luteococcus sp. Sow4_B9 TaxID=3438792 RepID=UPI003F953989